MMKIHFEIDEKDLRILVQSLENCLTSCKATAEKPDEPCEDCQAARALKDRLLRLVRV
jgi:hypothetical protein